MKGLFSSVTLTIYLFLSFTSTGSFMLNWPQTYMITNTEVFYWSSMEMGGFQVAATYNKPALEFKQSWANRSTTLDHWSLFNVFLSKYFSAFQEKIQQIREQQEFKDLIPEFKNTSIPYLVTVQCWTECPSPLVKNKSFAYKLAFNNEYEVHLNLTKKLWVAEPNPLGRAAQKILQEDSQTMDLIVQSLTDMCKQLAELFLKAGKNVFTRQIQPEVYIISRSEESETEVICMVTRFYPEPINVSLWKENKIEDFLSTETLPNGDGTYQITVTATVNVNEQQSVYCRVEHSSLKSPLIVHQEKKSHLVTGLVVGIGVPAILCAIALAYYIKKYNKYNRYMPNRRYTSITGMSMGQTLLR